VPHLDLWEPCFFAKFTDGPQTFTLDVLWLQEGANECENKVINLTFKYELDIKHPVVFLHSTKDNKSSVKSYVFLHSK
jgi:hypothetical protein